MTTISFKINGKHYEVDGRFGPDLSLAEFIREKAGLRGTKTMCQEGGCGACIVVARAPTPPSNQLQIFSVNSCLVSALSCHNWEITTVEGIGNRTDGYHDIQRRLATFNGTQCGYCTPGWICNMYSSEYLSQPRREATGKRPLDGHGKWSLSTVYGQETFIRIFGNFTSKVVKWGILFESKKTLTAKQVENSFASNMCRCTGYRPIVDAFKSFATDADERLKTMLIDLEDLDMFKPCGVKCAKECIHTNDVKFCRVRKNITDGIDDEKTNIKETIKIDKKLKPESYDEKNDWCFIENNKMIELNCGSSKWFKPYNLSDTFKAMGRGSEYKLIAGNTGQGVYHVTDYPDVVIDIFNVTELKDYAIDVNLILGAAMPLNEMMDVFLKLASENEGFMYLKQLHEHMDLVAHVPVRNIGTIGGNLFMKYENNDFQSDLFLIFETVGGMITIAGAPNKTTTISLTEFLKIDMKNKIILNVLLPPLSKCCLVKTYKIMPRSQNAHAVVNAGFLFKMKPNTTTVEKANIVYGSISPKFINASKTESLLEGKELFSEDTLQMALKSLNEEVNPEEAPPEPSAAYRKMLALALFYKAILYLCPEDKINPKYRLGGETFKRGTSQGTQVFDTDKTVWPISQPIPKLEALVQCSGEATFSNDLPVENGEVFAAFVTADAKPGSIISGFDASDALKIPGVIAFYTAKDIPGDNSFTPQSALTLFEEEILCSNKVLFYGQPAAIIVADRDKIAKKAAALVKVKYSHENDNKPLLTAMDVLSSPEKDQRLIKDQTIEPKETGKDVKTTIYGEMHYPSQYHYTMEPQTCVVRPTEDGYEVYSATQWLDLANIAVAKCINVPVNSINVIVRRVGGAYGGKITRSTQIACAAAIVSRLTGKTCRVVLSIESNMRFVGKRIPTYCNFELGTNSEGEIQYMKTKYYQENGCSPNEAISFLALKHIVNCYDTSRWKVESFSLGTDLPSNTWCRAPASTEGVAMIEYMMERIAYTLNKDPLEVRLANMSKGDNPIPELIDQLKRDSQYNEREREVKNFNDQNRWRKRSIKLLPMTYEIFYVGPYNAIVNIYQADGSVVLIHGGIEMGQGINTKAAQVCAYTLGIPLEKVSVKQSSSFTSPNSMTTGASIGSECVAYATMKACNILNEKLKPIREELGNVSWEELIKKAFAAGVDLQATGLYTPQKDDVKIYNIYAIIIIEIELDILTGNHDIRRVDLMEDVGRSLSPMIDVGQIEGAFVMGLGYWTSESLQYDRQTGRILTDRTWTYKPPGIKDIPADFRIYFRRNSRNPYGVLQSKATGEPALCLAVVITHALREAVRAARLDAGYEDQWIDIPNPCTVENIFMATGHKIEHFKLK